MYIYYYKSVIGTIYMTSDGEYLTRLGFSDDKKEFHAILKELPIFTETVKWLEDYFKGNKPSFTPKYLINDTEFTMEVINIIRNIPYGQLVTYNDIAKKIAQNRGIKKMSAQAVGGAVHRNPICIIIPCHRVIGTNNKLTGYGEGIDYKYKLLESEGHDMSKFKI